MLLCEMCRALNFNLGHSTCCDYVVFSSSIYLEFTFYPFLSSVRSQSAIESNSVDLIKRLSKTFVSLAELHLPAAFSHVHFAIGEQCQHRCIVSNLSRVIANNPGPYNVLPLAASHSVWACVFNCTLHSFSTYQILGLGKHGFCCFSNTFATSNLSLTLQLWWPSYPLFCHRQFCLVCQSVNIHVIWLYYTA